MIVHHVCSSQILLVLHCDPVEERRHGRGLVEPKGFRIVHGLVGFDTRSQQRGLQEGGRNMTDVKISGFSSTSKLSETGESWSHYHMTFEGFDEAQVLDFARLWAWETIGESEARVRVPPKAEQHGNSFVAHLRISVLLAQPKADGGFGLLEA